MLALDFLSPPNLITLAGVASMILGGGALIVSGLPSRSEALALRMRLVAPAGVGIAPARTRLGPGSLAGLETLRSLGGSLSEAERRQVVRNFSRVRLGADLAVPYFVMLRLIAAAVAGTIGFLVGGHLLSSALLGWAPLLAAIGAAVAGWIAPVLWIARQIKRRAKVVASGLSNALELLVVCVEAGLSLEDGLKRIANELKESQPALSDELALTWAEVNILPDRTQALANLAVRINNASVRSVVGVLSQGLRYGTPLAQALRAAVAETRNDQMIAMDEEASRLPALMTIPVMVFMMPAQFLLVGGPAALSVLDALHH